MGHDSLNRRGFLRTLTLGSAAVAGTSSLAGQMGGRPSPSPVAGRHIRIRGQVRGDGRPLARVSVTDGYSVVRTDADGEFEIPSDHKASFVYLSLPAGFRIPTNPTGTARFYEPIPPGQDEVSVTFDLESSRQSDENHNFLLLADTQTEDPGEMRLLHAQTVPDVRAVVRQLEGEVFGFACGDIMFDNLELFPDYEQAVSAMGVPFFQVVGNHDLDMSASVNYFSTETFRRHFGPEYYSFDRGAVHYVVLNDVFWYGDGYIGYVTAEQLDWLAADLAYVEKSRPVVVALHIPLLGTRFRRRGDSRPSPSGVVVNRRAVYELLEPYNAHVLSGHTHELEHVFEGGVHEHVHGAVCGAWWTGPICYDGTPSGYGVFEVRGEEIRWRYRSTGSDFSHQMRLYAWGADPSAPDEIVANVWDWDPQWKVAWYEDGALKGPMARRTGFDPLSMKLHKGPDLPVKRPWVEPQPTDHLFYAPASRNARRIRVEALVRFGRVYAEELGDRS